MTKTQEIPADVMAEARSIAISLNGFATNDDFVRIARALMARDTAARKECAEIIRKNSVSYGETNVLRPRIDGDRSALEYATAIEATITGGGE